MKRNITKYLLSFCLLASAPLYTGCDYLDIVPDERAQEEDCYKDVNAARGFLYSCYGYMPTPNAGPSSLDFMTGDEVVTAFEHETFANFPKGNFTAVAPVISYWNDLYSGIRQCYTLMKNIDRVPGIAPYKDEMVAELNFLVGYYHMLLFRCYGPIIVVDKEVDITTSPENYRSRSSLEQSVQFIIARFDDAINSAALPEKREGVDTGRATKVAARALKAYTLMYYASPLFNGNADLAAKLKNIDGSDMLVADADPDRWKRARDAYKEAIESAHAAGYQLFDEMNDMLMSNPYPKEKVLRVLRGNLCTKVKYNKEEIWTRVGGEGPYGLQKKSMPFIVNQNYNGIAPTMSMLRRFYTKNGLPYNVDPETKDLNEFDVVPLNETTAKIKFADKDSTEATIGKIGGKTSQMNLNREPRYYAWIAFQGGFYEVTNASYNGGYTGNPGNIDGDMKDHVVVTDFTKSGNCGRQGRNSDYSPAGFLNKKGVHPDNTCAKNSITLHDYPWPLIRLGEMYLSYAECCAESGDEATAKEYLNKIRVRAGIPTVEDSWTKLGVPTGRKLVSVIRQERMIELYLENQNFWDMRRWMRADIAFNHKHTGMNINATTMEEFSRETEIPFVRTFTDAHWLLPIPASDINNNHNVVQNPGY